MSLEPRDLPPPPTNPYHPSGPIVMAELVGEPRAPIQYAYPEQRRIALPVALFLITCVSTFWAGACGLDDGLRLLAPLAGPAGLWQVLREHWAAGLSYMLAVMSILLAHEMGHFLQAVRYAVPASLPYFLPMPLTPIGTMGAVIGMRGSRADRRQMFDIGLSGPLAGLVVALPITFLGLMSARVTTEPPLFQDPLLIQGMIAFLRPDVQPGMYLEFNPLYMAGWVGMLITGLNMLPIGQLDGGHVAYALWGRRAYWLARGLMLAAMLFVVLADQFGWVLMIFVLMLMGTDHPPTADDTVPLGRTRRVLGIVSLLIPVLCFAPIPIRAG